MQKFVFVFVIFLNFICSSAYAEVLAVCGASKGVSKYIDKNPGADFQKFEQDGMSDLNLALRFNNDSSNFYIFYLWSV